MRRKIGVCAAFYLAAMFGCVTIPDTFEATIHIDIRHVIEDQAEQALDYVEGKTDAPPDFKVEMEESDADKTSMLNRAWDFVSPVRAAYAQELDEGSPRAQQILAAMKKRYSEVERVKKTGAAGENNRGMLELAKPEMLGGDEAKNEAQRVIAAENDDRKAFYQEIARINQAANLKVGTVESAYAKKRLERAQPGELVQLPPAGEDFDAFVASEKGKKLGGEAKPGAWVVLR